MAVSIAVWAPSGEVLDDHYGLALRIISKVKRTAFDGPVGEVVEIQLALDDRGVIRLGVVCRDTRRRFWHVAGRDGRSRNHNSGHEQEYQAGLSGHNGLDERRCLFILFPY